MAPVLFDKEPELGDLIEIFRGLYQHWAVYIGAGYVVHLAPPCEDPRAGANSMMSVFADWAEVKKERLWDVVGTHQWRVNNSLEEEYHPRPPADIVRDAKAQVGTKVQYSVRTWNCEHFATDLRYGKAHSRQVRDVQNVAIGTGVAAIAVLGAVAFIRSISGSRSHRYGDSDSD